MFSKIFSFFGGLKITAILGGVIAILFGWIKIQGAQKKNMKEKIAVHEKEDEITDDMRLAEVKEEEKKDEAIKNIDDSDWRDSI